MKIVYMGTPDFAVAPLLALLEAGHEVLAVVTQPDKQKGRGKEMQMPPVKECALAHGIPVLQPVKIRENDESVFDGVRIPVERSAALLNWKMVGDSNDTGSC